jgi:hypothetical protein
MSKLAIAIVELLFVSISLRAAPPLGAVVQSWRYDPAKKEVSLVVANTSKKGITAISFAITITRPDGIKEVDCEASNEIRSEVASNEAGFRPGTTFTFQATVIKPFVDLSATVDVIVYADDTAEVVNEEEFKRVVLRRKGEVLGLEKVNELIGSALADPKDEHPSATVAAQLRALQQATESKNPDDPEYYEGTTLYVAAQDISNTAQSSLDEAAKNDQLLELVTTYERQIAVLSLHTEVTVVGP